MKSKLRILSDHGWVAVPGDGVVCAKCDQSIEGIAVFHALHFRHFHVKCAPVASRTRKFKPPAVRMDIRAPELEATSSKVERILRAMVF